MVWKWPDKVNLSVLPCFLQCSAEQQHRFQDRAGWNNEKFWEPGEESFKFAIAKRWHCHVRIASSPKSVLAENSVALAGRWSFGIGQFYIKSDTSEPNTVLLGKKENIDLGPNGCRLKRQKDCNYPLRLWVWQTPRPLRTSAKQLRTAFAKTRQLHVQSSGEMGPNNKALHIKLKTVVNWPQINVSWKILTRIAFIGSTGGYSPLHGEDLQWEQVGSPAVVNSHPYFQ